MAHGSAGQEVTLRHIRPQSHIVDQMVAEYYRGVNSSFCGWNPMFSRNGVLCIAQSALHNQHCTHSAPTTERRFLRKSANCLQETSLHPHNATVP